MVLNKFNKMMNLVSWKNRSSQLVTRAAIQTPVVEKVETPKVEAVVPEVKPAEPVVEQKPVEEVKPEPLAEAKPKKFVPGTHKIISIEELIDFRKTETDENNLKVICGEIYRRAKKNAKKVGVSLPSDTCDMMNVDQFIDVMLAEPPAQDNE